MYDPDIHQFCQPWNVTFTAMFHSGNVVLGAGYLIPQSFAISLMTLRGLMTIGKVKPSKQPLKNKDQRIKKIVFSCKKILEQRFIATILVLRLGRKITALKKRVSCVRALKKLFKI